MTMERYNFRSRPRSLHRTNPIQATRSPVHDDHGFNRGWEPIEPLGQQQRTQQDDAPVPQINDSPFSPILLPASPSNPLTDLSGTIFDFGEPVEIGRGQ